MGRIALAWGAVVAQVLFTASWFLGGLAEGRGYRVSADTISDLGALTADHPAVKLASQGIAGILTIAFALLALRPALTFPGGPRPVGAWLVAASPLGLENLADVFFRLDCRAADPGCAHGFTGGSWHTTAHQALALFLFPLFVIAPPVLASQFCANPAWRGCSGPALAFSPLMFAGLLSFVALHDHDGGGYAERALAVVAAAGVVLLALRTRKVLAAQAA